MFLSYYTLPKRFVSFELLTCNVIKRETNYAVTICLILLKVRKRKLTSHSEKLFHRIRDRIARVGLNGYFSLVRVGKLCTLVSFGISFTIPGYFRCFRFNKLYSMFICSPILISS